MANKLKLLNSLIDSALFEIELLSSSDDEVDEILDDLEENCMIVSSFRYSSRLNIIKNIGWYNDTLPNLDDNRFKIFVRVNRKYFNIIYELIKNNPVFHEFNSCKQFSPFFQLCLVMFRLGSSGESASIRKIASHFGIGDGGTLVNVTNRVFKSILMLGKDFLYWPTPEEREALVSETSDELPQCIGYLDGSEIPLNEAPCLDPTSYFSRTRKYSIKLQAICDAKLRIRHILVGYPGSVHDARIFNNSKIGTNTKSFLSDGQWIAADSAYKLNEHIITPFRKNSTISTAENRKKFNRYFSTYRVRIEHCFGLLKETFSSLKDLKIMIKDKKSHKFVCDWIKVCCILHNIILPHLNAEDFLFEPSQIVENEEGENDDQNQDTAENLGEIKRQALFEYIFNENF